MSLLMRLRSSIERDRSKISQISVRKVKGRENFREQVAGKIIKR